MTDTTAQTLSDIDKKLAEQRLMGGREERDGGAAVSAGGGGRDFIFRRP